ncbi:MAG: vitamin B12-dependent ribonucleotide reductase [Candidatus Saccharimonadales bacterium]
MVQANDSVLERLFVAAGKKAYDELKWVKRDSLIANPASGKPVFEQKAVDFPENWSLNAINIVAQKYFSGTPGSKDRERSLKQLIDRVVDTITRQGLQEDYFAAGSEAETFREELKYALATQRASFNSPVWFNIGVKERAQQASACFILGIEDTMPSILNWYVEEGMIFKGGSGSGVNLSPLRSSVEALGKSAGTASGPLSFMRGADASAGAIKSGGKTRRAAKMVILDVDHPDIQDFITSKVLEERKARDLQNAGWDMSLDGKDAFSVQYQNANISVRVTDEFMQAVERDDDWDLKAVTTGKTVKTIKARELMRQFAAATWECADPGMQFDTTINRWHTAPNAGPINGSNPCSEYMHLDNSACNLASLNLLKFLFDDNTFDIKSFKHTVEIIFTAQEILVGYSSYPTESIGKTARAYRQLGIGYANLGALLMAQGLPYDSEEGRAQAATITALMTGHAYAVSAKLARRVGPFAGFHKDREAMLKVLNMHAQEVSKIDASLVPEELLSAASSAWDEAVELADLYGVRNAQASLLAPTGTIGLMMDCDTTGIEPDLGLVKLKKLVGGGTMSIVNQTVPRALKALGYTKSQTDEIIGYIDVEKTILGAPHLKQEHEPVFACSMGDNAIHYTGHVKMMSAVQPFLSGAISKTVNMPADVSVEDIEQLHVDAWHMGLKSVAIYRDNSKVAQPLAMAKKDAEKLAAPAAAAATLDDKIVLSGAVRRELPKIRSSKTFSLTVAGSHGYLIVGEYEDGSPGEIFINFAKHGSTLRGIMDAFAISLSHGLQYGVPLKTYIKSFLNTSFAPAGITDDSAIRTASSMVDFIARRLALSYLSFDDRLELGLANIEDMPDKQIALIENDTTDQIITAEVDMKLPAGQKPPELAPLNSAAYNAAENELKPLVVDSTAPLCYSCGNQTQRSGSCYVCTSCGSTTGCS